MKKVLLLLIIPYQVFAQQFAQDLQKQLDTYYQSFLPLSVHVFTNQPEYAPGDTVFFKVDLMTAQGNRPVGGKSILHVTLVNSRNEKIVENGFLVIDGQGSNQLILPTSLHHDEYYLNVWSDWMTEKDKGTYRKPIRIGASNAPDLRKLRASTEGGILIHGVNAKLVIAGTPLSAGSVLENDKELLQFTIGADGTVSTYLTPKKDFQYKVVSGSEMITLPDVKSDGIGILITPNGAKNSTRIYLTAPENSGYRNKPLHLVVSAQGIIHQASEVIFKNQSFFSTDVLMQQLPQGIVQITLMDSQKNVVVERLINNSQEQPISTSLGLTKKLFRTRELIDLKLKTSNALASKISLTCFNASLVPNETVQSGSIQTDLLLSSDTDFDLNFSRTDNATTTDNKLVLAKWSRFSWSNLSKRNDNAFYSQYMHFTGTVFDIETNSPVPDSTKITFFMHKNVNTYQAYSNAAGEFSVNMLFEFYDADEVYYRVERNGKLLPNARVRVQETSIVKQERSDPEKSTSNYLALFNKRKVINESYAYHTKTTRSYVRNDVPSLIEDEIFGADVTIKMEDYHLFPTMIETLREVMPFSQHRKIHGKDVVRIFNKDIEEFRDFEPVYVIDGVMTDDTDYFLSINPVDIATIKLVHRDEKLNTFGRIGRGGMFLVETKIPDNFKNIPRSERTFTLKGISQPLQKGKVSHTTTPASRTPDLRTNLTWLPTVVTNANGEATVSFYTSDVPGKYKIEGEGVSSDGQLFTFEDEFEVTFQK